MPDFIPPGGYPPVGLVNKAEKDLERMEENDAISSDIVVDEPDKKEHKNETESEK